MSEADNPLRFFPLLKVLHEHGVEFVVIGGFAVVLHGVERATKDVDVVPEQSRENLSRLWDALVALEARPADLADFCPEEMPMPFSLEGLVEGAGNWVLMTPLGRIDVMQWVAGVESYQELRANASSEYVPEVGGTVWFAGLDDLLEMKREAGRDQDLIDITALRMAHGLEE